MRCWGIKSDLSGELGELEVESLNMVFKHDHLEYPEDSRG